METSDLVLSMPDSSTFPSFGDLPGLGSWSTYSSITLDRLCLYTLATDMSDNRLTLCGADYGDLFVVL